MSYAAFVAEIERLLGEGRSLFDKNETDQDPSFRKWRHRLTVLINTIEGRGYSVDCDVESRLFDIASYGDISKNDRIKRYNLELQDTLNELETIVEHFSKYGDPKPASAVVNVGQPKSELEWPQKVTLSWLAKHAPILLWLKVGGILITVFLLGIGFSETVAYKNIQQLWQKEQPQKAQFEPNKPLEPTR